MINNNIKWIMLIVGAITSSMILVAVAPQQGLVTNFGASLDGDLAEVVTRSWGMLIAITGGLLIYGALNPIHRKLVIVAACCSKIWFIVLNLWIGKPFLDTSITAVIFDAVVVAILLWYFFTAVEEA